MAALPASTALAQDVAPENMVILDLDRTICEPGKFYWFTDGTGVRGLQGAHQTMWEPLLIPNCGTGDLDPWLASGSERNEDATSFDVSLREGVTWSDGEALDADDVVLTVEMALGNAEITAREAATLRERAASVAEVDELTVRFDLRAPYPRFLVGSFGVRILGSSLVVPQHARAGEDPATFTPPEPIGTGPYTFESAATNRAIWTRGDGW